MQSNLAIRTDNQLAMGCEDRAGNLTRLHPDVADYLEATLDGVNAGGR